MRKVFKYALRLVDGDQRFDIPSESEKVVLVDWQGDHIHVWVECDPSLSPQPVVFRVFGTGHTIPDGYAHAGSVQHAGFVWHIYRGGA